MIQNSYDASADLILIQKHLNDAMKIMNTDKWKQHTDSTFKNQHDDAGEKLLDLYNTVGKGIYYVDKIVNDKT